MPTPIFKQARLKIKRADKHIDELEGRINAFLSLEPPSVKFDDSPGKNTIHVTLTNDPPNDLAPIIGDIFHNLRSSLDLVWNELIRHFGGGPSDYSRFPFHGNRDGLVSALNSGPIEAVPQSVRNFILNSVRPYKGGDDFLFAVHDLNIRDKHIALVPIVHRIDLDRLAVRNEYHNLPNERRKLADEGEPAVEIVFGKGEFLSEEPIVPAVKSLSQAVARTVEDIEKAVLDAT